MRIRLLAAAVAALLIPATEALAGDPVMPLGDVRAGMQCTGYSVVRGTAVTGFDVEVIDVVDDRTAGSGPRILLRASGPAVDATGLGPGFSGSPIYCADAQGTPRNIGAISESVGEYGGKVALATPIGAILGNPVDAPRAATPAPARRAKARPLAATPATARPLAATPANTRPLAAPLTITGLAPKLGSALQAAAARRGRVLLAAPAGPLGSFPVQQLRPGSAFGVGYASGDLAASAIGTVTYTDGDRVWGFGHPLDGVGARSLLLQDAYVFRIINNPLVIPGISGTYKYAAAGHDIGTLTNDALTAVAGRVGALPPTIPVRVFATDLDTGARRSLVTNVADETAVDQPYGTSILSLLAPLAVVQAGGAVLGGSPARLSGRGCFAITFKELAQRVRFCNRYVTNATDPLAGNAVAASAGADLLQALSLVDAYQASPLRVTGVEANLQIRRGRQQAYLRKVRLPRRARAGQRVPAAVTLRYVGGRLERRKVRLRLPSDLRPGRRRVVLPGTDIDVDPGLASELVEFEFDLGGSGGDLGAPSPRALAAQIEGLARYDGVSVRRPRDDPEDFDPGEPSYRDPRLRISGQARAAIRITRR
jgi:hypothetical protein